MKPKGQSNRSKNPEREERTRQRQIFEKKSTDFLFGSFLFSIYTSTFSRISEEGRIFQEGHKRN
jgi:hypothetical protein